MIDEWLLDIMVMLADLGIGMGGHMAFHDDLFMAQGLLAQQRSLEVHPGGAYLDVRFGSVYDLFDK